MTKPTTPSGSAKCLSMGRYSVVSAGALAVNHSTSAAHRPAIDCQEYFQRAASPFELPTTSFR